MNPGVRRDEKFYWPQLMGCEMGNIETRAAIHDLFTRYATALDNGETETVVDCFTADAMLESPAIGVIAGRDAIRSFAQRFAALRAAGTQFRHFVTNIAVEIGPDGDRARATTYLLVMISKDDTHRTLPPGRYECDIVKAGATWRFSRRTVFHDHDYILDVCCSQAASSAAPNRLPRSRATPDAPPRRLPGPRTPKVRLPARPPFHGGTAGWVGCAIGWGLVRHRVARPGRCTGLGSDRAAAAADAARPASSICTATARPPVQAGSVGRLAVLLGEQPGAEPGLGCTPRKCGLCSSPFNR
jgi:uncharacterized protein (TIGR02246 family)